MDDRTRRAFAVAAHLDGVTIERQVPLAPWTTFRIGGPADVVVKPASEAELVRTLAACRDQEAPWVLLAGGSNVLVGDGGFRGVVIRLGKPFDFIEVSHGGARIAVGAATKFPTLTKRALELGWPPAVGWMGTPGHVGGALKMNAGTRHGELGEVVREVSLATADGCRTVDQQAAGFGYRSSRFAAGAVLTATLLQCDKFRIDEANVLTARARELLRQRQATQPKARSAGSIFKNPPGDFAGRLIDAAGLKGVRRGDAQVSEVHANFIVNLGQATASDVVDVAHHVQEVVQQKFSVALEWEVKRLGEFS